MTANDTMFDTAFMPPQELSVDVLMEKYAADHETGIDDVRRKVARALPDHELPALKADIYTAVSVADETIRRAAG